MDLLTSNNLSIPAVAALCVAAVVLLWMTYTDYRHFLLPDKGNIVLAVSGLAFHALTGFIFQSPVSMLVGAIAGAMIFIFSRWYGLKVKKIDGVGLGDIKFAAAAGLWLGAFGVSLMVLSSAIILLIIGSGLVIVKKKDFRKLYLPFGAVACPVTLVLLVVDILFVRLSMVFG